MTSHVLGLGLGLGLGLVGHILDSITACRPIAFVYFAYVYAVFIYCYFGIYS